MLVSATPPDSAGPAQPDVRLPLEEVRRLLDALSAVAGARPVPIAAWAEEVNRLYAGKAKSTRLRTGQALREAAAIAEEAAGGAATTASLGPELVARLAAREGRSSTTAGLLRALRAAYRIAVDRGWADPAAFKKCEWSVPDCDPEGPRKKHHARADVARALAHLRAHANTWDGHRLYCFLAVLAYTGLRRNEALCLRWEDVDLERGFVFVRPRRKLKTKKSAAPVPVPAALARVLAGWRTRCGSEWVLPGARRAGPWTGGKCGDRAGDRLKAAALEVGVSGMTPHTLRHSLATHLKGYWGLSSEQVRMVLRHTTERTQAYYVHDDLANLGAMVRGFEYDRDGSAPGRRPAGRPTRAPLQSRPVSLLPKKFPAARNRRP